MGGDMRGKGSHSKCRRRLCSNKTKVSGVQNDVILLGPSSFLFWLLFVFTSITSQRKEINRENESQLNEEGTEMRHVTETKRKEIAIPKLTLHLFALPSRHGIRQTQIDCVVKYGHI